MPAADRIRPTPALIDSRGARLEMGLKAGLGSHPSDSCAKVCDQVSANRVICDCKVTNTKKNGGFSEIGSGGSSHAAFPLVPASSYVNI